MLKIRLVKKGVKLPGIRNKRVTPSLPLTTSSVYIRKKKKLDSSIQQPKSPNKSMKPITSNELKKLIDKYKKVNYDFIPTHQ